MAFMRINGFPVPVRDWKEAQSIIGPEGRGSVTGSAYRGARAYKRSWQVTVGPLTIEEADTLREYANGSGALFDQNALYSSSGLILGGDSLRGTVPTQGDDGFESFLGTSSGVISLKRAEALGVFNKFTATGPLTSNVSSTVNNGSASAAVWTGSVSKTSSQDTNGWFGTQCYRLLSGAATLASVSRTGFSRAGMWVLNPFNSAVTIRVYIDNGSLFGVQSYDIPAYSGWVWCETGEVNEANGSIGIEITSGTTEVYFSAPVDFDGLASGDQIGPLRGTVYEGPGTLAVPDSLFNSQRDFTVSGWLWPNGAVERELLAWTASAPVSDDFVLRVTSGGVPELDAFGNTVQLPGFGAAQLDEPVWLGLSWDFDQPEQSVFAAYSDSTGSVLQTLSAPAADSSSFGLINTQRYFDGTTRPFGSGLVYLPFAVSSSALTGLADAGAPTPMVRLDGDFLPPREDSIRAFMKIGFNSFRRHRDGAWRNNDRSADIELMEF